MTEAQQGNADKSMDGTSNLFIPVWFANTNVDTHTFLSRTIRCLLLL